MLVSSQFLMGGTCACAIIVTVVALLNDAGGIAGSAAAVALVCAFASARRTQTRIEVA